MARPDIIINTEELKNVYVPPVQARRSAGEVAASFLPKPPVRRSRLAIASVVIAAAALCGIAGAIAGSAQILTLGIVFSIAALVTGILGMLAINNHENRLSGLPLAGVGIVLPVALIVVYFACLGSQLHRSSFNRQSDIRISENRPTEQQISRMPPPAANAMRANVVIKCAGMFGETRYGSGVIVRLDNKRAYILTNKHVIGDNNTDEISVIFYTGEQCAAKIEWRAKEGVDIAVIGCQVLTLADYRPVRMVETMLGPGEKVFAVGNPMGLPWSYTEGTISGLRTGKDKESNIELYQTQTPINSGNSGGGLYTMDGGLVGINTLTQDKSVSEGLNFAIAIPGILKLLSPDELNRFLGKAPENPTGDKGL